MADCKDCKHYEPCACWHRILIEEDILPKDSVLDAAYECEYYTAQPTAQERPVGHWLPVNDEYGDAEYIECSECGEKFCSDYPLEELAQDYKFCPMCGAEMEGAAE